jgi:hypothetical protein
VTLLGLPFINVTNLLSNRDSVVHGVVYYHHACCFSTSCYAEKAKEQTQDRRIYEISPVFPLGNTIELDRYRHGWLGRPYELFPPSDSSSDKELSLGDPE